MLAVYTVIMAVVLVWGSQVVGSRMVSAFSTMFSLTVGLGSGYLLGRTPGVPGELPPDDPAAEGLGSGDG